MGAYIVWAIAHVGALAMMLFAAAGVGHLFLRKCDFDSLVERLVFTTAIGLGVVALLIFALALAGVLYQPVLLALTMICDVCTACYLIYLLKSRRVRDLPSWRQYYSRRGAAIILLVIIGLGYWGLLLLSTQYPPVHWDAIAYHLVLSRAYLTAHRLVLVMGIPWPVAPALNHMLFTWGMALKDDIVAQMVEHSFLMLTAAGLYSWGKRERSALLGLAAAALWLGQPLVLWLAESAYVDVCLATYVFLGVYALRVFWDGRQSRWWYLAMALLGMASGVKVSGPFFVIIGGMLGLWVMGRSLVLSKRVGSDSNKPSGSQFTWRVLVYGWVVVLVTMLPWYAFFTYYTGNPVWPAFPQFSRGVWGAPAVVENMNNWYKNAAEPRTLLNFLMLPIDWIRYPSRFFAEVGLTLCPMIVAWPMSWIIALWNRSVRWWVFWALSFTFYWFLFAHQLRYWLPALPFAILALYESIRWIVERLSRSSVSHAAIWIILASSAVAWGGLGIINEIEIKGMPPTNKDEREAFLSLLNGYNGVKYVNRHASEADKVCVINGAWLNYYFKPEVLDLFAPLQSGKLPSFRWPNDEPWVRWLESQNIEWIFINHANAPAFMTVPKQNLVLDPFWPDYQLVYSDSLTWVFRHKPVPPDIAS
jgi:hypothetical protein